MDALQQKSSKSNRHKHSIFISWLLSYLFILIVPLIISSYVYINSVNIIESEVERANYGSLIQLKQHIDGRLREIERIGVEVALDGDIGVLMSQKKELSPNQRYHMLLALNDLKVIKTANQFIDEILVYFKHNDFILSSYGSAYDTDDWYKNNIKKDIMSLPEFTGFLQDKHVKEYGIVKGKSGLASTEKSIAYLQSLPINGFNEQDATLMITINNKDFKDAINGNQWISQGVVAILDINDDFIITTKAVELPDKMNFENLSSSKNLQHAVVSGEESIMTYVKSDVTDWLYISIIPTQVFLFKLQYIRRITLICTFICLIAGGLIAYLFASRNHKPVAKIVKTLSSVNGHSVIQKTNEYSFIENSLNSFLIEREQINKKLLKQKEVLRDNFLIRLMKGRIDKNITIDEGFKTYNIAFEENNFAVMLYYIDDFNNLFFKKVIDKNENRSVKNIYETNKDSLDLSCFIIKNIVEENVSEKYSGCMLEIENIMACLINIKDNDIENARSELYNIANISKDYIEKNFGICLSVSISNIHGNAYGISTAYQEAIEAMEYMQLIADNFIIHFDSIYKQDNGRSFSYNTFEEERRLQNCIMAGNFQEAEAQLEQLFNDSLLKDSPSVQMIKCRMFGLINIMMMALKNIQVSCDNDFFDRINAVERLIHCETLKELKAEMKDLLKNFSDFMKKRRKDKDPGLVDKVMLYINKNFSDKELNVSTIAEYFNINISYLSRIFKEQNEVGLLESIHRIRIDHAKDLLTEGSCSIKEISDKVGYYNPIAFIRVFKKYEGIPPGQYGKLKKIVKDNK